MPVPLRLLILEDNPFDAELAIHEIRRAGFDPVWRCVETEADFLAALTPDLDLVLSDYNLPQFDGLRAFDLMIEQGFDIPFILVSGAIGEERAVEAMKKGVIDYLLKDRLARLGPAITNALRQKQERQERRDAQAAVFDSEMRYRRLFEASQDGILILDAETLAIADVNPFLADLLGFSPEDLVDRNVWEVEIFEDNVGSQAHLAQVQQTQRAGNQELTLRKRNGERVEAEVACQIYRLRQQDMIQCNIHDITRRKRAEDRLRESEAFAQNVISSLNANIAVLDAQGTILAVNQSWHEFAQQNGSINATTIGPGVNYLGVCQQAVDFDGDPYAQAALNGVRMVADGRAPEFVLEYPCHAPDELRWFSMKVLPLEGVHNGLVVAHENITERKQAGIRTETQLQRLAALHVIDKAITSALDLTHTLDVVIEQVTTQLNVDAACILLLDPDTQTFKHVATRGFRTAIAEGASIRLGASFAGRAALERRLVQVNALAQAQESPQFARLWLAEEVAAYYGLPLIAKDRVVGVLEIFHRTAHTADEEWYDFLQTLAGQAAIAVENDSLFTETERLLRQAQSQAQLTQDIIDSAPEGMLVLDSQHRLVLANPVARDYLPSLADVAVGEVLTSLGGKPLADFLGTFGKQQPWQEMSWGQPPRVYEVAAQPLSVGQQMSGWVMILRDITAEKENQRYQQVQEQLATVGQMAAGIAHDFNNIMGAIVLYTQLLRNDPQLTSKHHKYVDVIHDQSRHAAELIRQILDFSRRAPMENAALDVVPLLKELIKLWERTLPENLNLELDYDRNECIVYGDPTRLQQVLMNLALNARDAMPQGGTLSFQLASLSLAPGQMPPLPDMAPGEWLQLSVRDTGTGIAAEHLPHLFEPFFTTKQPGQGTGLGLAQVHGIVKQHDGSIAVESQPGRGTTFVIYLPIYETGPAPAPAVVNHQTEQGAGESILLVEDNEAMRMALADSLEGLGYRVFPAVDGIEALEILAQQTNGISLMLSDLVMPRMGGVELSHQARSRFPALKIIIMTGHPLHESEDELRQAGIEGWIRKPFSVSELTDQVQAVLGVRA